MQPRDGVLNHFGWWVRVYYGFTYREERIFRTKVHGREGVSHGVTLRLRGNRGVGIQIRKNDKAYAKYIAEKKGKS